MGADGDRGELTLAERLRAARAETPAAVPPSSDSLGGEEPRAPETPKAPAAGKRKRGRPAVSARTIERDAGGDDSRTRRREWARTLRAMDLLVVHGYSGAVEALRLECGRKDLATRAVDHAERYLAEHRHEVAKGESRAQYKARMAYLFHASLDAEDLRNARQVARDLALAEGVILSDEQAPGTSVASGLDVSDLTDEERGGLRELLDSARRRIAGGGGR